MSNFLEKLKKGMGLEDEEEKVEETEKTPSKKILLKEEETKEQKEEIEEEKTTEGELLIDLFEDKDNFYVLSPIAGIKAEDLDIEIEEKKLTIEGERKNPAPKETKYIKKECYWGKFKREIEFPSSVDLDEIEAEFKHGILFLKIPKRNREKKRKISLK
jgi:HSP20 family protein